MAISSWTRVVVVISALAPLTKPADSAVKCGDNEVPLTRPRKETFCKPQLTSTVELHKLRKCVCMAGYVRSAWGQCIRVEECNKCKKWPNADYRHCETVCPLTCGKPFTRLCTKQCRNGCACPPGYVRGSSGKFECVPVKQCTPKCQPNSTFQVCKLGCEPICNVSPPKDSCVPRCHAGQCVCNKGFAEAIVLGKLACVPWEKCPKKPF